MPMPDAGFPQHLGGVVYPSRADALTLHLSVGADLLYCDVARNDLALRELSRLVLPAPVQYVCLHPTRSILYVAWSNRSVSRADDLHGLSTVEVDAGSGEMRLLGQTVLPTRPIHLTVDPAARCVLVVYNAPSRITTHAIRADGTAAEAAAHSLPVNSGIFPHQVVMLPSERTAVIVARGNHALGGAPEQPGSLEFVSLENNGSLVHRHAVAPGGGFGFGPRHLDIHPGGGWAAVSLERQNEVQIFRVEADRFSSEPVCRVSTLAAPTSTHDQLAGTIRFHPSGEVLYVVNRHDTAVYGDGAQPSDPDGNNIAVFAFDARSGRADVLQRVPTHSVHVRTFSLDAGGRLLAAASILPARVRCNGVEETLPARLSWFGVGDDGRLTLAKIQDMPPRRESIFWSRLNGSAARAS